MARTVLLIRGAMGLPRNRKRWVVGAVAAAIAVWLGGACLGACDLNPHPLPPNALSGSGDEGDATVAGNGSSSGGSGSGSGSTFNTGGDGGVALPAIDAGSAADDGGGADVSMSPDAGGDAAADAGDAGDAAADAADAESAGSDAMSEGPDAAGLDGSGD
jgi:hypothetical protein